MHWNVCESLSHAIYLHNVYMQNLEPEVDEIGLLASADGQHLNHHRRHNTARTGILLLY